METDCCVEDTHPAPTACFLWSVEPLDPHSCISTLAYNVLYSANLQHHVYHSAACHSVKVLASRSTHKWCISIRLIQQQYVVPDCRHINERWQLVYSWCNLTGMSRLQLLNRDSSGLGVTPLYVTPLCSKLLDCARLFVIGLKGS